MTRCTNTTYFCGNTLKVESSGRLYAVPTDTPKILEATSAYTRLMCRWSTFKVLTHV